MLIFFVKFALASYARAQDTTIIARTVANAKPDYMLIVSGSVGAVFGVGGYEFAQEYNNPFTIGGQGQSFDVPLNIGGTAKFAFSKLRYGLAGDFSKAVMPDNYSQAVVVLKNNQLDTLGFRDVSSNLSVSSIPLLVTVEFMPVEAQFSTYVGLGAGIAFNSVFWSESLASSVPADPRKGGVYIDESQITPAGRVYAGVELDFDKRRTSHSILGSLLLEVRYTYIPVSAPLLKEFAKLPGAPSAWSEDFRIGGSGLGINIGVSVEFPGSFR
ncbi:MAG TPA: hypothetical protein VEC36_13590 [Patescibacteria group bacterium]|nr:hypothetical protein [Patescibacteria group bacterium]